MQKVTFDVMLDGKFVMQHTHGWFSLFPINMEDVKKEIYERKPSLRDKNIELFITNNILK